MIGEFIDTVVDTEEALVLLDTVRTNDIHATALLLKGRALFSETLSVHEEMGNLNAGLIEKPPVADLELYFQEFYTPVLKDALMMFVANGYAAVRIVDGEAPQFQNRPMKAPVLVPRGDYELIGRRWKDGREEWFCRSKASLGFTNERDPSIHVFFMDFCKPSIETGKHFSIVSPSMTHIGYERQLYGFLVEAHKQRSHPPVCYEAIPPQQQDGQLRVISLPNTTLLHAQDRLKENQVTMAVNEKLIADSLQHSLGQKRGAEEIIMDKTGSETKRFRPTVVDNAHFVPQGYKIGAQCQLPEAQTDLLNYTAEVKEAILALHGIPASIVMTGARNNSKTTTNMVDDNDFVSFQRTLRLDAHMLCRFATFIYLVTFPELNKRSDVKFTLKMIPFSSPSAIHRMFETGIITSKARNHTVLALNGMDYSDEAEEPEDIHRPPLNGTENQTTALMRSKERVPLAEAKEREANARAIILQAEIKQTELEIKREELKLKQEELRAQKELLQLEIELEKAKAKSKPKV